MNTAHNLLLVAREERSRRIYAELMNRPLSPTVLAIIARANAAYEAPSTEGLEVVELA